MLSPFSLFFRFPILALFGTFAALIAVGTFLLSLPWAVRSDISFLDALFTATSAATLTGLVVKSTGGDFTFFGQLVILLLIQVGIIGIMTGAAFFFLLLRKGLGLGYQVTLRKGMEEEYIGEVSSAVKFIVLSALVFEAFGAAALYLIWHGNVLPGGVVFSSIFHSVSAFGNAGFSLFNNSLQDYRHSVPTNAVFMFLIVCGGIGFIVLRELGRIILYKIGQSRPGPLSLHTKLVLVATFAFFLVGFLAFVFMENDNAAFDSPADLLLAASFQSVTARTAGFSTVPIQELSAPALLVFMLLMFVGGAAGSAAGGIKVTTAVIATLGALTVWRGKRELVLFRRTVPDDIVRRALASALFLGLFVFAAVVLLVYLERGPLLPLAFETVSAFGTVGLSLGVTPGLSSGGKIVIILVMFVGRLAPLTLAIAGGKKLVQARIRYPEGRVNLG